MIEIPLQHLTAEFDDTGEGRLLFRDAAQPDWTIFTSDREVLEFRSIPQIADLAEQLKSQFTRRDLSRRIRMVALFFTGCGLALWLGMLALGAMVRSIVAKVPPEVE